MKILFITHYDNMYGANRALYKLIYLLKTEYGHEPYLVIPSEGEMTDSLSKIGVKYYVSGVTQWQADYTTAFRFAIKKILRTRKIKKEVNALYNVYKNENIDVIHSNSSVIGHGAMLAEKLGCKHIWHIREFSEEHFNMQYFYNMKNVTDYYEKAERIITISDALRNNYEKRYKKAHICRVYDGVSDYKAKCDLPENINSGNIKSDFRFLYAGYLFSKKHQDHVIEACKILKNRGISHFKVFFAGSGKSDYTEYLQNMINEGKLEDNVKLCGYIENMSGYMSTMDCGIIASEYEGFGLVTVEYMLHSLPVIGYDSGATPEIVINQNTGLIYSSIVGLADSMQNVMNNYDMAKEYGMNGRKRALEFFSEENNARQIADIYKEIEDSIK